MPNVGPWLGWRMQVNTFFPKCAPRAWLSPTVVVVLPSPKGVGVIAVTTMYFPLGEFFSRSRMERCTLAFVLPYRSNSSARMPASVAIWPMGSGVAACAISISLGTRVRMFVSLYGMATHYSRTRAMTRPPMIADEHNQRERFIGVYLRSWAVLRAVPLLFRALVLVAHR